MAGAIPFETFAPLAHLRHAFSLRTHHDTRSTTFPSDFLRQLGYSRYAGAEQPHGNAVATVATAGHVTGVDALITRQRGLPLVIRCADCAPVFIVDRSATTIALIHSGKKGTLANVVGATLSAFPADPSDCLAFIGPCIGPCHYEMDLVATIRSQLETEGITNIHQAEVCNACSLTRYYSYRAEKGQTGRMFAVLALD